MVDFSSTFTTTVPECIIETMVLKAVGCIESHISEHIKQNGFKIEGE